MNFQTSNAIFLSADEGGRWYVVQTLPRSENKSVTNLMQQGFTVFCPRLRRTVRHARRVSQVLAPLFPNYLFINMDVGQTRWRSINGTFGVSHLLMQNEMPLPVPRGVVEAFQTRMDETGVIDWSHGLKVGQGVRIVDGPFTEFIGELEYLDAKGRVRVLLNMMGRQVSVASQVDSLVPAV
jgi:transcription elongation factor/antiterminator RfaH